jgi:aspartyl/asparaginyl beta-hydroxylase (cupin superfamily)
MGLPKSSGQLVPHTSVCLTFSTCALVHGVAGLIFDDAYEHETWNETDEDRVVLLFDLWHWELSEIEIESIQSMFREVEARQEARKGAQQE